MAFELDVNLPPALAPLAWLVGRWEGAGVLGYPTIESVRFGQEVVCSHDGRPFLEWQSRTWLLDDAGNKVRSPAAKEYNAGSRMYGLADSQLLWAMDMAAVGQSLQSHVSAQLKRVG